MIASSEMQALSGVGAISCAGARKNQCCACLSRLMHSTKKVVSRNQRKIRGLLRMCVRAYVGTRVQATLPILPQMEAKMSQKHRLLLHCLSLLLGMLTANQCCKINT